MEEKTVPDTWVTDITHFLDEKGAIPELPAPARRLARYFGAIIAATSLQEIGQTDLPVVRCRRRPGRRPCPGTIRHEIDPADGSIVWHCPICGDNGTIYNWEGSCWDCGGSEEIIPTIAPRINAALERIEEEENVTVVYACESGSRAWGFESADSDYDVRFLYVHPTDWYLTIQPQRDVIERSVDGSLDMSGWDLRKALHLFRKSNPPLLEWLQSPVVYREKGSVSSRLRQLMPVYYSPISCMYHYLHMARGNYREYLQGEEVWVKKYFYVLRPVLACLWIEQGLGVVPMEFAILVDRIIQDRALRAAIDRLLAEKKRGEELSQGPRIPEISRFLDIQLSRLSAQNERPASTRDSQLLDRLFVEALVETNGPRIGCRRRSENGSGCP